MHTPDSCRQCGGSVHAHPDGWRCGTCGAFVADIARYEAEEAARRTALAEALAERQRALAEMQAAQLPSEPSEEELERLTAPGK